MKKTKLIGIIALFAIIVLGVAGCSSSGIDQDVSLTVKNESSVTVRVEVKGGGLKTWTGNVPSGAFVTRKGSYSDSYAPWYTVKYIVDEKTGIRYSGDYTTAQSTCTITQEMIDNL